MEKASHNISLAIVGKAKSLGFTAVGFAKAELLEEESAHLKNWLSMAYDADMKWIERGFDKRRDINLVMDGARSVISLAFNYFTPVEHDPSKPKISRYAWGKDYHKILKKKLKELCGFIESYPPLLKGGTRGGYPLTKSKRLLRCRSQRQKGLLRWRSQRQKRLLR